MLKNRKDLVVIIALLSCSAGPAAADQQTTVSEDKDWSKQSASLKDTREAE